MAEDITQQAWIAYLNRRDSSVQHPEAWLRKVIRRITGRVRSRRRLLDESPLSADPFAGSGDPEDQLALREWGSELARGIEKLPDAQAEVLRLRFFEELSIQEVANRLNVPVGTVKSRTSIGLKELRETLDRKYGGRHEWTLSLLLVLGVKPGIAPNLEQGAVSRSASVGLSVAGLCGALMVLALALGGSDPSALIEPEGLRREVKVAKSTRVDASRTEAGSVTLLISSSSPEDSEDSGEEPLAHLEVYVLDDAGQAIPGAVVSTMRPVEGSRMPRDERGVTDSNGMLLVPIFRGQSFDVSGSEELLRVIYHAGAAGKAHKAMRQVDIRRGSREFVEFQLDQAGIQVAGQVLTARGQVPPGLTVLARSINSSQSSSGSNRETAVAAIRGTVNDNGQYKLRDVGPGALLLDFQAPGFTQRTVSIRVPSEPSLTVPTVHLEESRSLRGAICDLNGAPIHNARVFVPEHTGKVCCEAKSGADGRFQMDGLPQQRSLVLASAWRDGELLVAQTHIEDGLELNSVWDPVLESRKPISLRLVNEEGTPLDGWRVLFRNEEARAGHAESSDEGGHARLFYDLGANTHAYLFPPSSWGMASSIPLYVESDLDSPTGSVFDVVIGPEERRSCFWKGEIVMASSQFDAEMITADRGMEGWLLEARYLAHDFPVQVSVMPDRQFHHPSVLPGACHIYLRAGRLGVSHLMEYEFAAGRHTDLGRVSIPQSGSISIVEFPDLLAEDGYRPRVDFVGFDGYEVHVEAGLGLLGKPAPFLPGRYRISLCRTPMELGQRDEVLAERTVEVRPGLNTEVLFDVQGARESVLR